MSDTLSHKKKAMLEGLRASLGIVTRAADLCQIDRRTHYRWLKEDTEYAAAVEDIDTVALDFAESKLHKLIDGGNATAIIFYLKTKGKGRGYVERQEVVTEQPKIEWR
jgi:hypothetical protein